MWYTETLIDWLKNDLTSVTIKLIDNKVFKARLETDINWVSFSYHSEM